jgi:hypothetical protein
VSQAQTIIDKFGGVPALAKATGFSLNSVYKWTYPKEKGGTGGLIPASKLPEVYMAAQRLGIELSAAEVAGVSQRAAE